MTFGIGFVSPHYAGIVTDRLLSGDRAHDDSDKCGAVSFTDGHYAYTFAGLAEVGQEFQTRRQLARALCEAGRPDQPGMPATGVDEALRRVAMHMTEAIKKLPVKWRDKRMSILLAGYRYLDDRELRSEFHLISNYEKLTESPRPVARSDFDVTSLTVNGAGLWWVGCSEVDQAARSAALHLMSQSRVVPPGEVVKLLVGEIRRAAEVDEDAIGRQCSSIVALRDGPPYMVDYHAEEPVSRAPATANVVAIYGNVGAFVTLDGRLSNVKLKGADITTRVQPVHKRQRCPCGSGRQYKNCHGNPRVVHKMDSYSYTFSTATFAIPEDGSPVTNFSNDMFKQY
jgi:SEC-C motif